MQRRLTDNDLTLLRQQGVISQAETAYWIDDRLVAENTYTKQRRNIQSPPGLLLESQRRVLRG